MVERSIVLECGETCGGVGHETLALGGSNLDTQVGLGRLAELALLTLWCVQWNDMIADLDTGDALTNGFDDAGTLVTQDTWEETFWILA